MLTNNVLVILEVLELKKSPDLRFVTIGNSDNSTSEFEFGSQAIATFRAAKNYSAGTTFTVRKVIKFDDIDSYVMFLKNQLSEYLDSLKNPQ